MIIEIIVIIMTVLIPAYCIWSCSGEEQQIVVQADEGAPNDINNGLFNNDLPNNNNNNEDINNNDIATDPQSFFEVIVKNKIKQKKKAKTIDWEDIKKTANVIYNSLDNKTKKKVEKPLEKIEKILKNEKLETGKKAVMEWRKENEEKYSGKGIEEIANQIYLSDKNNYTFNEEKKRLLTAEEIKHIIQDINPAKDYQRQENEMKELEELVKKKEEEEKKEKKMLKKYDEEAELAKQTLGKEPDEKNPNACLIIFKLSDGKNFLRRRFLKTDKVSTLYDYVKSEGRRIFMEPDATNFKIFDGFPPTDLESFKNKTLEERKLVSNAMLQIKEE